VPIRIGEWFAGYIQVRVLHDPDKQVLATLVQQHALMWNVRTLADGGYTLTVTLRDVPTLISQTRKSGAKLRFGSKSGLPFWLWRAGRRKVFLLGGICFVLLLYGLSSFIWHVQVDGTDEPEAVASVLQKLHVRQGSPLYRILDQDSLQLALLDQLPALAWVGVRIQGTAIYVHVIMRVAPSDLGHTAPQSIVARVPGVITSVLASSGQPIVKPGQYIAPGAVLISGVLADGKRVYASGKVQALVWYRTQVVLPERLVTAAITGEFVHHYYLLIGHWPLQVWGFSRPPYAHKLVVNSDQPLQLGGHTLPFIWRVETVYDARQVSATRALPTLSRFGLELAARDVLRLTGDPAKLLRQSILQKKLEHGKLYMTIWSEVVENIGRAQSLASSAPLS